MLRGAAAVVCLAGCLAAVALLAPAAEPAALAEQRNLDQKLRKILNAEQTAAGAIDLLWHETSKMPSAHRNEHRLLDGPKVGTLEGDEKVGATWSARMGLYLHTLNDLELPEAEELAPSNLDLHLYQNKATSSTEGALNARSVPEVRKNRRASAAVSPSTFASSARSSPLAAPLPALEKASVTAIRAAAAARVEKMMSSVKTQQAGTEQLVARVAKPQPSSFFNDALRNLAARKQPLARSHLKARTMMLAEAPEQHHVPDTEMAIRDAVADEGMGKEAALGDTLEGHWHAPMWPNGHDEGSPVLTSTIAAPGQGGEFAYGFPYDEAKLFAVDGATGDAIDGANATAASLDDVVDAAEAEAKEEKVPAAEGGSATPFYEGVGAGGNLGPKSQGGWNGNTLPPAMPDDAQREEWLKQRANGYSDEFSRAAQAISNSDHEQSMVRENSADEAEDGQQGAAEDSHVSTLRQNIAQFVGAFGGHAQQHNYALHSVQHETEKPAPANKAEAEASAMPGARQMLAARNPRRRSKTTGHTASRLVKMVQGDENLSDKEFLAKFKPKTVDEGEDFPCGWPGPPCAYPAGESTAGGFLGGLGPSHGFGAMNAKSIGNPAQLALANAPADTHTHTHTHKWVCGAGV